VTLKLDEILVLRSQKDFQQRLTAIRDAVLAATHFADGGELDKKLSAIIKKVNEDRDAALTELTEKFDGVRFEADKFRIASDEIHKAHALIEPQLLTSIRKAIDNIRRYQQEIFIGDKISHPGLKLTPVRRVGVCVPGASAPLPSTVIMTAVPAQVAGVDQIAVISPPRYRGSIHPVTLAVCHELGIDEIYRVGGAQAVAALAMGTPTIEQVDKIVGPGNQWVQMAKKKMLGHIGIDSVAGPSEVLIIANDQAHPDWVAADMLSQAEHAPGSAVLFTDSENFAMAVLEHLKKQLADLDRTEKTVECLRKYSGIVVFESLDEMVEWADIFAAEHLQIQWGDNSRQVAQRIRNAGAIFVGHYTPVAVGDYWAGPSHTLPTGGSARFFSALSSNDFIKSTSVIEFDKKRLENDSADIIRLAQIEGLDAHARSIGIRLGADTPD